MTTLKNISDWILKETQDRLGALNIAISNDDKAAYAAAKARFDEFIDGINNQDPDSKFNGPTIHWAVIQPIMDEKDGFFRNAAVIIKWLGGTHSSSAGVAIPH
jgi:hypothetical protein